MALDEAFSEIAASERQNHPYEESKIHYQSGLFSAA
jgi:hypothetical protein